MKRIISMILALALIVGTLLTTTSCLYTFQVLTDPSQNGGDSSGDGSGDSGAGDSGNNGSGDSGNGSGDGSGGLEFYPGLGESDIPTENVTAGSRALLSTVAIVANFKVSSYGFDSITDRTGYGSGVIYSLDKSKGDAYIITNYHVVHNSSSVTKDEICDDIEVYLYGQEMEKYKIAASYVGGSLTQDLAVLKISGSEVLKNSLAVPVIIGDSDKVSVLDSVIAVGNPEGYGISVTSGIISVDSETLVMTGSDGRTTLSLRVMRTSAAINNGNSGGGLYSADGKLIGIVNAKRTGEDVDNIGYAIPINLAKNIADNILYYCDGETNKTLKKCQLGITLEASVAGLVIDEESEKLERREIVEVARLEKNCVMPDVKKGDRIKAITIDGTRYEVTRVHHVIDNMLKARVGSTVELEIKRGEQTLTLSVTLPESSLIPVK